MATREEIRAAVDNALSGLGDLVTGWTLTYEAIDSTGEQFLGHEVSEGMADWTRIGMLYAALEMGPYLFELRPEEE